MLGQNYFFYDCFRLKLIENVNEMVKYMFSLKYFVMLITEEYEPDNKHSKIEDIPEKSIIKKAELKNVRIFDKFNICTDEPGITFDADDVKFSYLCEKRIVFNILIYTEMPVAFLGTYRQAEKGEKIGGVIWDNRPCKIFTEKTKEILKWKI